MCGIAGLTCLAPSCDYDHRKVVARMCDSYSEAPWSGR